MKVTKIVQLKADPSTVWNALTTTEQPKQYFFGCEAMSDWTVGIYTLTPKDGGTELSVMQGEFADQTLFDQTSANRDIALSGLKSLVEG